MSILFYLKQVCACGHGHCMCDELFSHKTHHVVTLSRSYCVHPPFLARKEIKAICVHVCVHAWHRGSIVCVLVRESEQSHSYYIKQDFPEQSAPATELPKPSSGFPLQRELCCCRAGSRLFVLERHCSGAAEAMSQPRCPSAHLPRIALLNV